MTSYDEFGNVVYTDEIPDGSPDPANSVLSVDYYRGKVQEFQVVLNSLDATYVALWETGAAAYASGDQAAIDEYESLMSAFEAKRFSFQTAVTAIKAASSGINAMGISFPTVQLPYGLSAVPLVPLAAAAAAIGAAVVLITWAHEFFAAVRDYAQRSQHLAAIQLLPEGERANAISKLRAAELEAQKAEAATSVSPLQSLASIGKWVVIGGVAFLAYRVYSQRVK